MAQTQISDVVVPAEFTAYQVENSMVSTALYQSGVAIHNGEMAALPGIRISSLKKCRSVQVSPMNPCLMANTNLTRTPLTYAMRFVS